jgi:hypothetical protein
MIDKLAEENELKKAFSNTHDAPCPVGASPVKVDRTK